MGPYLSQPKTEKETCGGENGTLAYAATHMQGNYHILFEDGEIQWKMLTFLTLILNLEFIYLLYLTVMAEVKLQYLLKDTSKMN